MPYPRRGLRSSIQHLGYDTTLEAIWAKYDRLNQIRSDVHCLFADAATESLWSISSARITELFLDPIERSQRELVWAAIGIMARDPDAVELKRKILAHCISDHASDIVSALAESIESDMAKDR